MSSKHTYQYPKVTPVAPSAPKPPVATAPKSQA